MSFRHNNDVIIALCVRWARTTSPLRPCLHIYQTHCALVVSGCWFHIDSAYLHIITVSAKMIMQDFTTNAFWQILYLHVNLQSPQWDITQMGESASPLVDRRWAGWARPRCCRRHHSLGRKAIPLWDNSEKTNTVEPLYSTIGGVHEMRSCYRRILVK